LYSAGIKKCGKIYNAGIKGGEKETAMKVGGGVCRRPEKKSKGEKETSFKPRARKEETRRNGFARGPKGTLAVRDRQIDIR